MVRPASWLLAIVLLLSACVGPFWKITPLEGQTPQQLVEDRSRCHRQAFWHHTREGSESRAWWGGPIATTGVDVVAYQGCLEARGYRVE